MISVIIPAYNVQEYIGRTLDSILAQTYTEIEIIVVNDGSKDGTADILDTYTARHPDKIRIIHIPNSGVTNARLTGVQAAKGDWIGFVDGDDVIEPDMYERLLGNAQKYHADISHCGYQMVFSDGRVNYFYNTDYFTKQDKTTGLLDLLDGSRIEPGLWNKLFRKNLFYSLLHDEVMDRTIRINEDLLMNFYLFREAEQSVYEDFCPYHYMVRSTSASRQKLNEHKIYDPIKVKKIIMDAAPSDVRKKAEQMYLSTCINVYNSIVLDEKFRFVTEQRNIRNMILSNWNYFSLLTKKQRLLACFIRYMPALYRTIYRFYAAHFLKSRYF